LGGALPCLAQYRSTDFEGGFMSTRRAKLAAGATVLGLGALGGVALGTNQGVPAAATQQVAGGSSARIVTSASGAAATPASQPIAVRTNPGTRPPVVTRASGGGPPESEIDD
jgi:hypothetical protein